MVSGYIHSPFFISIICVDSWLSISRLEISNLGTCHENRLLYKPNIHHLCEDINATISSSDKSNAVYLFSKPTLVQLSLSNDKISTYPPECDSLSIARHLLGLLMYPELRKAENPPYYLLFVRPQIPYHICEKSQDNCSNHIDPDLPRYFEFLSCPIVKLEQVHPENGLLSGENKLYFGASGITYRHKACG